MKKDLKGKKRVVPPGIEIPGIPTQKTVIRMPIHAGRPDAGRTRAPRIRPSRVYGEKPA